MSNNSKSAKSASSPRVGIFIASSAKGSVPSSGGGGIEEAPIDGTPYVRQDGTWVPASDGSGGEIPELWAPGSGIMGEVGLETAERLMPGTILPASDIWPGSATRSGGTAAWAGSIASLGGAGSWELRGFMEQTSATGSACLSYWVRIDSSSLMSMTRGVLSITNCRYSSPDNSTVDCVITANGKSYPFTASPNDSTEHGPAIYANAVAGEYGSIAVYE